MAIHFTSLWYFILLLCVHLCVPRWQRRPAWLRRGSDWGSQTLGPATAFRRAHSRTHPLLQTGGPLPVSDLSDWCCGVGRLFLLSIGRYAPPLQMLCQWFVGCSRGANGSWGTKQTLNKSEGAIATRKCISCRKNGESLHWSPNERESSHINGQCSTSINPVDWLF